MESFPANRDHYRFSPNPLRTRSLSKAEMSLIWSIEWWYFESLNWQIIKIKIIYPIPVSSGRDVCWSVNFSFLFLNVAAKTHLRRCSCLKCRWDLTGSIDLDGFFSLWSASCCLSCLHHTGEICLSILDCLWLLSLSGRSLSPCALLLTA